MTNQSFEMIFTNEEFNSFAEAKSHAIESVKDGDNLWLNIRLPEPLKNYVFIQKMTQSDGSVQKLAHFHLGIGPVGYEDDYQTDQIWVGDFNYGNYESISADLLDKMEFSLCLTAFKKNRSSKLFISIVGTGDAGIWENEIRMYRGVIEAGVDNPPLATVKITCDLDDGLPLYRKMWDTYETILTKGDPSENTLPEKTDYMDQGVYDLVMHDLKLHRIQVNSLYFVQPWMDFTDNNGQRCRQTRLVYVYEKEEAHYFGFVAPSQKLASLTGIWGPVELEYERSGFPIAETLI